MNNEFQIERSSISEIDLYKENEVIVFCVETKTGSPFKYLMLQLETELSEQLAEKSGMYIEMDNRSAYKAIKSFEVEADLTAFLIEFVPFKDFALKQIKIDLTGQLNSSQNELLRELERSFNSHGKPLIKHP